MSNNKKLYDKESWKEKGRQKIMNNKREVFIHIESAVISVSEKK